jgi:intracellular sulfur oxidation DsrE/DsrF family protein
MTIKKPLFALLTFLFVLYLVGCGSDGSPTQEDLGANDSVALAGVAVGKGFFDINISASPETIETAMGKLLLYLDVIKQTYEGLENQGVPADIVIAFRGMAVTLITGSTSDEIKTAVTELEELGVKFEACSVATNLFGINNATILPEIKVVGNTFISAIGYQAKGYSPILIQ